MKRDSRIFVAGGTGLVGSAITRRLAREGYTDLVASCHSRRPDPIIAGARHVELDILRQGEVEDFFRKEKPEYVFLAAARVGGIMANSTYRADFIYENIMMAANIIRASKDHGVKKLINLGSK
jgi:GDP-L-fucose synthase